jgi:histidyl-tRNA synthetase
VSEKFQAPKGTYDVLPSIKLESHGSKEHPWTISSHWIWLEQQLRTAALSFGFQEIRTPIFEHAALFSRTAGEVSDVVSKEMYTFEDRGNRVLALRPEGTAPAARALIEAGRLHPGAQERVYYLEPMFRYERPQAGRFRQHSQFGVEWYGCGLPEAEVECIHLMWRIYQTLGLKGISVHLNTLGSREDRSRYRQQLVSYLEPLRSQLSEESQARLLRNPLRILDTKSEKDIRLLQGAPTLIDSLSNESRNRFERVKELLRMLDIPFVEQPRLVRGFDYYTHTVWEIVAEGIGAQGSVGGGGRYDHLVHELGGGAVPAVGFGMGMERLMAVLSSEGLSLGPSLAPQVVVIPLGEQAIAEAIRAAQTLRQQSLCVEVSLETRRLKHALSRAAEQGSRWAVLLGSEELQEGKITLKDLFQGTQERVTLAHALEMIGK